LPSADFKSKNISSCYFISAMGTCLNNILILIPILFGFVMYPVVRWLFYFDFWSKLFSFHKNTKRTAFEDFNCTCQPPVCTNITVNFVKIKRFLTSLSMTALIAQPQSKMEVTYSRSIHMKFQRLRSILFTVSIEEIQQDDGQIQLETDICRSEI
jgi:hypothetical protein